MGRMKMVGGERVPLTPEEEVQRDAEEATAAWKRLNPTQPKPTDAERIKAVEDETALLRERLDDLEAKQR